MKGLNAQMWHPELAIDVSDTVADLGARRLKVQGLPIGRRTLACRNLHHDGTDTAEHETLPVGTRHLDGIF